MKRCNECSKQYSQMNKNPEGGCTPPVIQINNDPGCVLFHKVVFPASIGDDTTNPPSEFIGKYKNVLLVYEANNRSYMFSSDGMYTQLNNGVTDYEEATNLPQINSNTLIGDKTGAELGLQNELTAGANIQIDSNNVISATDTTYGPATDESIGLVKPGDGLSVQADGTLGIADIEEYAHFFDTVADMKSATNLIDGSFARTLGFYSENDGGGALYKITSTGDANEHDVIALTNGNYANIVAEDVVNIKQFGAKGDDTADDTEAIQAAIDYAVASGIKTIYVPAGTYATFDPIYLYQFCEIKGENYNTSIIKKHNNDKGSVVGLQYDAIIIMTDTTYDTSTALSNDKADKESINNISLVGNITGHVAGKTETDYQYAIYSITNVPKAHIENILIQNVDAGIDVKRLWTGYIKEIVRCHAYYVGVRIRTESQGTLISNINIISTRAYGLSLSGGTYGSVNSVLVEFPVGGDSFYFNNWHGTINGCGTEQGTGSNVGLRSVDSKITINGAYFATSGYSADNNRFISVQNSDVKVENSVFGTYSGDTTMTGKLATIYDGSLDLENNNKYLCTFTQDISTSGGKAFVTVGGKTYDVARGTVSLPMPVRTIDGEYDYIDSKINPTTKHPRSDIYMDNINYPYRNTANGSNNYGMAYGKGDIGIIRNPLVTGHIAWFCNRDNKTDNPTSVGTIASLTATVIEMTDLTLENYDTTGIRFFAHCNIVGVTSGATAEVSRVEANVNKLVITSVTGTFVVGEKIRLAPNDFWRYGDYLYIPFIHAGYTEERPTTGVLVGQMFYDRTLGKPIWYNGSAWKDASGTTV